MIDCGYMYESQEAAEEWRATWVDRMFFDPHRTGPYIQHAAQYDEDISIYYICQELGIHQGTFVDIGAGDGVRNSNVYTSCVIMDWGGLMVEYNNDSYYACVHNIRPWPKVKVHQSKISLEEGERIDDILALYDIKHVDVLSLDIDGYDFWVWGHLEIKPTIMLVEVNYELSHIQDKVLARIPKTISYDPTYLYEGTKYYGANVSAMWQMGRYKGYTPIMVTVSNMIFVKTELVEEHFKPVPYYLVHTDQVRTDRPEHENKAVPPDWIEYPCFSWLDQLREFQQKGIPIGGVNRRVPKGMTL